MRYVRISFFLCNFTVQPQAAGCEFSSALWLVRFGLLGYSQLIYHDDGLHSRSNYLVHGADTKEKKSQRVCVYCMKLFVTRKSKTV